MRICTGCGDRIREESPHVFETINVNDDNKRIVFCMMGCWQRWEKEQALQRKPASERVTIRLTAKTKQRLAALRSRGDSYGDLVERLLDEREGDRT